MMIVQSNERIYLFRQCLISITGLLHGTCAGSVFGYTSILFPQLDSTNATDDVVLSLEQKSWIASVPTLAMFPATIFAGWALEQFGRKKIALTAILFNFTGWLSMYLSTSYTAMLSSRILSGIFAGMGYPIFLTYLGEVTDPHYRAFFLSFLPLGCTIGVFICQLVGSYLTWRTLALLLSIIPMYNTLVVSAYISESYIWCKNQGDTKRARRCFTWFRGAGWRATEELSKALEPPGPSPGASTPGSSPGASTPGNSRMLYTSKAFLVPFGITTLTFTTGQLTGNIALIFYTSKIFEIITKDPMVQYYSTTALNILRILATAAACVLVKMISVRKVLTVGGLSLAASLFSLSGFLYLATLYPDVKTFPIMCIVAVILDVVFFAISLGPLPSVICGELYPGETRGVGGSLSACLSFLSLFIVVKVMPLMLSSLTPAGTFLLFGAFTVSGVGALAFVLPDTKDKTLKEIGNMYH